MIRPLFIATLAYIPVMGHPGLEEVAPEVEMAEFVRRWPSGQAGGVGGGVDETVRRCDVNYDGFVDTQDFFDFLTDWFAGHYDFNHDGANDTNDYFAFLNCLNPGITP